MWKGQQKTDLPCLPGVPRGGCRKTGGLCDIIVAEVLAFCRCQWEKSGPILPFMTLALE